MLPDTAISTEVLTAEAADPLAGTPYRSLVTIGAGGMGVVYCAEHRELGNVVAVKVLRLDPQGPLEVSLQLTDRARIEGQVGARLTHPNLVAVRDLGRTAHGQPYMVMEYLKGKNLHQRLEENGNGPLPLAESLDVTCQALLGLQVVHDAGLVHRDLKPSNLFLCEDGTVKVLDLGCAKVVSYSTNTPPSLAFPTAAGIYLGTPRYMAPEQASLSGTIDHRADIYAMGCVLYRLLCGRGPFDEARTFDELQHAHQHELPRVPSTHLLTPLPSALDDLLLRCLSKDPSDRPASAAAMAAELRRIELEAQGLGEGYVTDTVRPPTTLNESARLWDRPPPMSAPPRGSVTYKQLILIAAACILVGLLLGGIISWPGEGG